MDGGAQIIEATANRPDLALRAKRPATRRSSGVEALLVDRLQGEYRIWGGRDHGRTGSDDGAIDGRRHHKQDQSRAQAPHPTDHGATARSGRVLRVRHRANELILTSDTCGRELVARMDAPRTYGLVRSDAMAHRTWMDDDAPSAHREPDSTGS